MHNFDHDLIHQLSEKLDSLWRYDMYLENAKGCSRCENMWKALKEKDMEMANLLREEIKLHIGEGKFEYCGECFAKAPKK
ncbi:hypothetical protein A2W39_00060 [Candidatus Azambacteria bacterium RIFCSPHIGHO2_01_46_10]|uniref:Uncharacterized protein n=11 Tax=Candidatus Azamiibacteriota TaxID=1752741 RepID=A0A1F5C9I0_9BACT|nr:MAG: hypothetical protein UX27_C0023G0013 [Candidatus Azambacteria bacterium GW2011_GWA2_45_90]KKU22647.1 MAG: hypothetical protein UX33_C0008G0023 [Candidatus Azambacteria bacterium GW2011_GWC1_46_13]KKU34903.1 MAG: hypothetical protein UX48_C0022G0005 [Candidatus Azambacteria bacterium GW2011_GWB1_46_27]KKU38134.1 MAG: hypothetical protein UX51_C0006G0014 [Candidatus Azambacteria bacterium GW2011_GWF2_46_32]KKU38990.1 MAG: hypothetical protein UX53_C0018G0011 [Candidatus Azambacteria bacte